jgi:hypothetical protein
MTMDAAERLCAAFGAAQREQAYDRLARAMRAAAFGAGQDDLEREWADLGTEQRGYHPDGRPVTDAERHAAFTEYQRLRGGQRGHQRPGAAMFASADGPGPLVRYLYGLDG